jgi:hypothetical protein
MHKGDDSGNEMLVRFRLPSGLEILWTPAGSDRAKNWSK